MLSDEEKEALRNFKSEYETCDHYSSDLIIELDDAEILLNLIEKQSKEIEELKNGQIDFWISDKEIEDRIKNKFTSNDKIKAKIEELEKGNKNTFIRGEKILVLQSLLEKE